MKDLESMLGDLDAAERAGVFARTPAVEFAETARRRQARFYLVSPKWAVAAALIMAAGVWTFMFQTNISEVRGRARAVRMAAAMNLQSTMVACTAGPESASGSACGRVDFDGDGDVDLGDFSKYQRELVASSN